MNQIQFTSNLKTASFYKGASRIVDLFGKLDSYKTAKNADFEAIKNDWENVGNTIFSSINKYDQK